MAMTKTDYLLLCLAEECAETIHRVAKALRFDLDHVADHVAEGQILTNRDLLEEEINDLLCTISHLQKAGVIDVCGLVPRFSKGKKFEAMLALSRELGRLEPEGKEDESTGTDTD